MRITSLLSWIVLLSLLAPAGTAAVQNVPQPDERLRRGAALMRAGRSAEAEAVFKSVGERESGFAAAQTLLGYTCLRRSALDPAIQAFQRALAADPAGSSARYGLGIALSRNGSLEDAASQFEQIFGDPALGVKARSQWIQISYWMGRDREAYEEARRLSVQFPSAAEYQSLLGFFCRIRGDNESARRAFERALQLDPGRMQDYQSLISLCRARRDWQGALDWIQKAISLDPNQPLLLEELASVDAKLGLTAEAEAARGEARRTMDAELLYAKSARARAEGRPGESEDLLRRCLQANPRLAKAWADFGEILRGKNRLEEAQLDFQRALQIEPSNHLALLGLAAVLEERKESRQTGSVRDSKTRSRPAEGPTAPRSAVEEDGAVALLLLRAVQDYPNDAELLTFLGRAQDVGGNPQAALESYSEALRIDPLQVEALLGKAGHFLDAGEARRASDEYRRAADLEPSNTRAWQGLVQALRAAGEPAASESACRQCLAHNPGDPDCLEPLAYLKMDGGDYRAAADLFETILRDGRASKDLLDSQGFARMKLGEPRDALELFESSLKRYGPDTWVYFNLGFLYQAQGNIGSAIVNYRRARALSPRDAEISHNLGFALYLSKDYAAALEPLKSAVRLKPDWGLAHFNLAMTYWNLRQYGPALTHARIAEQKGLAGAASVVQALSANLSPGTPKTVSVFRRK